MRMSNLVSGWLVGLVLPGVALAQGAATAEERERLLLARIAALEARLAALEARLGNGERAVVCASPSLRRTVCRRANGRAGRSDGQLFL